MDLAVYLFLRALFALPEFLSRPAARLLATLAAALFFSAGGLKPVRLAMGNLDRVCPGITARQKKTVLRKLVETGILNTREAGRMGRDRRLDRRLKIDGLEHLERALAGGRGVIALSAHLGNFPLVLYALGKHGVPIRNIGRDPSNRFLRRKFISVRERTGIVTIPQNPAGAAVRAAATWVKKGNALSLLADQFSGRGTDAPFFGYRRGTPAGPAVLARRLGCPVVPVFIVRLDDGGHEIRIAPPLDLSLSADAAGDIRSNSALFNRVIEEAVRKNPEQWLTMFTRRFR